MRWPQFLLTCINLGFAVYLIIQNVFLSTTINPLTFLWTLIYISLALAIAHLYMLYMSNKIDDWYDVESMKSIRNLSIVSLAICTLALATTIGLEYYHKKEFMSLDSESIKQILPLGAALVSSIILFSSSIKFKKYVILCKSAADLRANQKPKRNYQTTDLID